MAVAQLQFHWVWSALLLFMLLLLLLPPLGHSIIHSVPFHSPQDCTKKQFFDISRMACRPCGANQQTSPDGTSCICQPGYKLISNNGGPFIRCEKCPVTTPAVTQDGWSCIRCPSGATIDHQGKCRCSTGHIKMERSINGAPLTEAQCELCNASEPSFSTPDPSAKLCVRCHNTFIKTTKSCDCKSNILTGGLCFLAQLKVLTASVVTNIVYAKNLKVSSAWFINHLKASAIACLRFANLTACQALGNMCVMTMNSLNIATPPNDACGLYQTIFKKTVHLGIVNSINSWRKTLPWLYYIGHVDGVPSRILRQDPFPTAFHFKPPHERMKLQFVIAKYDARGYFLSWEKVTGGTLQLCPDTMTKLNIAYIFGITYQQQCTLSVSTLLSKYRDIEFYDMYMLHIGENGEEQLHPIAVRNLNLQYNGKFVNQAKTENSWYLTRRFFLVDTLTGREVHLNSQPKVIRVAKDIKIRVNLVPKTLQGNIFPPFLTISYANIKIQNPEEQTIPVSFSIEYEMDLTTAYQNTEIALGFLSGVSTINAVLKTTSWKRRIGSQMIDIPTILKFLLFYAGDLANTFFVVTFGTGFYWLTFFKGQRIVSVLLPTSSQEMYFIFCVVSAFALKLLQLLHKLGIQLTVDIFFIDWERPKGKIVKSIVGGGDIKTAPAPVSIWRTYFVANEWNNIQTIRKINPIFQIVIVIFILEVVGFANLTSMNPYSQLKRTAESDVAPSSYILRFGMASTVWLTVGIIQVVFYAVIYERFVEDRISQFIDVCSISNISVMIFSYKCFGYYIHGRSVHGHADTNMEEMNLNLKREAENLCGQRGLVPNTETESFQIFITKKIREQYDKIREPIHLPGKFIQHMNNSDDAFECRMKAYNSTNKFLSSFIDHAIRDMDYIVQDKLLLERLIDMELHEPTDKTIFYNDEHLSFTDILYYGNESTLLIFDTLFFCVVDLAAKNFILAAFLTYIQQKVIQFIRVTIGRKNVAAKTLVDERFLL